MRIVQWLIISGLLTTLSAQATVIELDCNMQSDSDAELLKSLTPAQATALQNELERRGVNRSFYTLDTEKRTLRLRWLDQRKGGYDWRTIKDLQKRTLPDGVIAYTYEREERPNDERIKSSKEMFVVMPEVKTVHHVLYAATQEGKEFSEIRRGACK